LQVSSLSGDDLAFTIINTEQLVSAAGCPEDLKTVSTWLSDAI